MRFLFALVAVLVLVAAEARATGAFFIQSQPVIVARPQAAFFVGPRVGFFAQPQAFIVGNQFQGGFGNGFGGGFNGGFFRSGFVQPRSAFFFPRGGFIVR